MTSKTTMAAALATFLLTACGGGQNTATAKIGPEGGTLKLGAAGLALSVPAGALKQEVEVRAREVEPGRGRDRQVELEPKGLVLAQPARVSFQVSDDPANHEMEVETEHGVEVRPDDGAGHDAGDDHPRVGTTVTELGTVALKHKHGADDPADHDAGDDHGVDDPATHDVGDDNGVDDPATHDVGDDNGIDPAPHP